MKPLDLIGQKFNKLTVIEKIPGGDGKGHTKWKCLCDCGNFAYVVGSHLRSGHTKSCRCQFFEINKKELMTSSFTCLWHRYKQGAKARNIEFNLSKDYFGELTSSNCHYCGTPPSTINKAWVRTNGDYIYNGVDRVDNNIGYVVGNVVPCCGTCNTMKLDFTKEYFLDHISKIYLFNQNKIQKE